MSLGNEYPVSSALTEWTKHAVLKTLPDVFKNCVAKYGDRPYVGTCDGHQFKFKTYREVNEEIWNFASALLELGLKHFDRVANFSVNRPEWPVADFGTVYAGGVHVPMYPTLSTDEMAYIVDNCEARLVVASCKDQIKRVIEAIKNGSLPNVEYLITMDEFRSDEEKIDGRVRLWNWNEFLEFGASHRSERRAEIEQITAEAKSSDVCSLVYTSGTTGNPKGAMLMHGNFVSQMDSLYKLVDMNENDVELSFLPLSHVFERVCYYTLTYCGSSIGYTRGIKFLTIDLKLLRPTLVPSVPRLFEKIFAKIVANAEGGIKGKLFNKAISVGRAYREALKKGHVSPLLKAEFAFFDYSVFSKVRDATGGRVRLFVSGGAPARADVLNFFLDAGLLIIEGYGLTETSPVLCLNRPGNINPGTVGETIPGVEAKIADDGELCFRGPNIMRGYFKLPEATADVFDEEGFFHTGDVGEFNEDNGCYTITDRKKEILVLSNGKNVPPAPLESAICSSPWIEQAVAIGNNRSFVGALVVPNFEKLEKWAKERGLDGSREELVQNLEFEKIILREIGAACEGFSAYEKVRRIAILPREFKASEGEVTPSLKIKRRIVSSHFAHVIEAMYGRQTGDFAALKENSES